MQTETIVFGGGCFWCTEAVFKMLKGVQSVEPAYADTVEVVKIEYDPDEISFEELLRVFFATHDATTLNRQGNDVGPQYRSAIFYTTERQKEKSEHYIKVLNKSAVAGNIVTEVAPLANYFPAEDYHKNYFENHKDAPYCQLVIAPKVEKIEGKFSHLLK
jgi:peptide-methionine (S)-S-oxide reductase